jgi:hypothetical protein
MAPGGLQRWTPRVVDLERLRQELQAVLYESGSLADYLDLGHPNEQQRQASFADIERYKKQEAELARRLGELLVAYRATAPQVIGQWAGWHASICKRIIAQGGEEGKYKDVSLYLAQQTLDAWGKVLRSAQDFVLINNSFLHDYNQEVTALADAGRASMQDIQEPKRLDADYLTIPPGWTLESVSYQSRFGAEAKGESTYLPCGACASQATLQVYEWLIESQFSWSEMTVEVHCRDCGAYSVYFNSDY